MPGVPIYLPCGLGSLSHYHPYERTPQECRCYWRVRPHLNLIVLALTTLRFIRGGGGVPVLKELEKQLDPVTHQLGTYHSLTLGRVVTNTSIRIH
jgi:hypothetical protein